MNFPTEHNIKSTKNCIVRDMKDVYYVPTGHSPCFSVCVCVKAINFSKKSQMRNSMKIHPMRVALIHADKQE